MKKIVVIGGGTGPSMLLSALKHKCELAALVAVSDDGGSSMTLRDELGVLQPGDTRQCLLALSDAPEEIKRLINYRFDAGALKGHAFGNILIAALEKTTGNFAEGVKQAESLLQAAGRVIPVTLSNVRLHAELSDGTVIEHERDIDTYHFGAEKPTLSLAPEAPLNPEAREFIASADVIVIGPGDVDTSVIAALLPQGMGEALKQSKARKVYVANLVCKANKNQGMQVGDYVEEIERHLGQQVIDLVLYNNGTIPDQDRSKYLKDGEELVGFNQEILDQAHYRTLGMDFMSKEAAPPKASVDVLERSLARHDGNKLAETILNLE